MNKDMHQIYEAYKTNSANIEVLEEGLFSRLAARGAGAVGAVKGMGQQIAGTAKGAVAGMKGDVAGVQAAQTQKQQGAIQGQLAKINSYQQTAQQKFAKVTKEVFDDIAKLGIDVKKISPKSINVFTSSLNSAFENLKNELTQAASQPNQQATPTNPDTSVGKQ